MKNNKKGFTIVELVIVIAVIAILAAVLIPTFSNVIEKAKMSNVLQTGKTKFEEIYSLDYADGTIDGKDTTTTNVADQYLVVIEKMLTAPTEPTALSAGATDSQKADYNAAKAIYDADELLYDTYKDKVNAEKTDDTKMVKNQVISITDGKAMYEVNTTDNKVTEFTYTDKDNKYIATYDGATGAWTTAKVTK